MISRASITLIKHRQEKSRGDFGRLILWDVTHAHIRIVCCVRLAKFVSV